MNIQTTKNPDGRWQSLDLNQYDGPGSPIGYGDTREEALDDLIEQTGAIVTTDAARRAAGDQS